MQDPGSDIFARHPLAAQDVVKHGGGVLGGEPRHLRLENVAQHAVLVLEAQDVTLGRIVK